tara:strand:+ start:322 stop:561 length:240 start_codon:yes stop_codon:yes gene_type:complete
MGNITTTGFITEAVAVTKSDSTVLDNVALYVGTGGDLTITMKDSATDVVFKNVPSGTFLPIAATKVKNATTAADILAIG